MLRTTWLAEASRAHGWQAGAPNTRVRALLAAPYCTRALGSEDEPSTGAGCTRWATKKGSSPPVGETPHSVVQASQATRHGRLWACLSSIVAVVAHHHRSRRRAPM